MKKYLILSLAFAFALTTNAQNFFQKTSDGSMLWLNKQGYNTCLVKGMTENDATRTNERDYRTDNDTGLYALPVHHSHQYRRENRRNGCQQRNIARRSEFECVVLGYEIERTAADSAESECELVAP